MKYKPLLLSLCLALLLITMFSCTPGGNGDQSQESTNKATENEPVFLTIAQKLENIKNELKIVKAELTKEGKYNCCVHPACDWCLLNEGECTCHENLKSGKEVCPACGLGWHNGKGVVEGVKASQVKWNITHEHAGGDGHKH
ncbi:MAG: hypothetical protein ACE5IR_15445 [bacterium]